MKFTCKLMEQGVIPLLPKEGYLEMLARQNIKFEKPLPEAEIKALFNRKLDEVNEEAMNGGMLQFAGFERRVRAAYMRASTELEQNPTPYQMNKADENP